MSPTVTCDATGPEFNPYGEAGTIDNILADASGVIMEDNFLQETLNQNLGGENALIGKSISIFLKTEVDADPENAAARACCVIGQDADPSATPEDPDSVTTVNWKKKLYILGKQDYYGSIPQPKPSPSYSHSYQHYSKPSVSRHSIYNGW